MNDTMFNIKYRYTDSDYCTAMLQLLIRTNI